MSRCADVNNHRTGRIVHWLATIREPTDGSRGGDRMRRERSRCADAGRTAGRAGPPVRPAPGGGVGPGARVECRRHVRPLLRQLHARGAPAAVRPARLCRAAPAPAVAALQRRPDRPDAGRGRGRGRALPGRLRVGLPAVLDEAGRGAGADQRPAGERRDERPVRAGPGRAPLYRARDGGSSSRQVRPGERKAPHHIRLRGGGVLGFAGLYTPPSGDLPGTYCIITTEPNALVARLLEVAWNRMAVS